MARIRIVDNQLTLRAHSHPRYEKRLDQLAVATTELSPLRSLFNSAHASGPLLMLSLPSHLGQTNRRCALNSVRALNSYASRAHYAREIQAAMPPGFRIEFVRYHRYYPRQAKPWQEARYVAYILPWHDYLNQSRLGESAPTTPLSMPCSLHPQRDQSTLQRLHCTPRYTRLCPFVIRLIRFARHPVPDRKLTLYPRGARRSTGSYELEQRLRVYVTSGRDSATVACAVFRGPPPFVAAPDYVSPISSALNAWALSPRRWFNRREDRGSAGVLCSGVKR